MEDGQEYGGRGGDRDGGERGDRGGGVSESVNFLSPVTHTTQNLMCIRMHDLFKCLRYLSLHNVINNLWRVMGGGGRGGGRRGRGRRRGRIWRGRGKGEGEGGRGYHTLLIL